MTLIKGTAQANRFSPGSGGNISQDYTIPQALFIEALALARQHHLPAEVAQASMSLGFMALIHGELNQASRYLTESLTICCQNDIPWILANVLIFLVWVHNAEGEREAAKATAGEAVALHRESGDMIGIAAARTGLGKFHSDGGDFPAAEAAYFSGSGRLRFAHGRIGFFTKQPYSIAPFR